MKKYNLFLDDIRDPHVCATYMRNPDFYLINEFVVVRNYDQFVKTITEKYEAGEFPDAISFDHDLADEHYRPSMYDKDRHYSNYYTDGTFKEKTGYDCALWLVDFCIKNAEMLPRYIAHSMNPVGAENIVKLLENFHRFQLKGYGKY